MSSIERTESAAASHQPPGSSFTPAPASVGPFHVYYGWYNVIIALAAITLAVGSTTYSFGLYIKPAAAELGLTRAATNLGLILFHVGSALFSPIIGIVYDRFPIRLLLRIFAVLFFAGMAGASVASSPALIGLFIFGLLSVGVSGSSVMFGIVIASRWFTHYRSRAILIVTLGTSMGGLIVYPLIAFLMGKFGWRETLAITAALVTSITLAMSFFVRPRPDPATAEQLEEALPVKEPSLSPKAILTMADFWLIIIPVDLLLAVDGTIGVTIPPYMLDRGMTLAMTATVISSMTATAIGGKLLIAWIADRMDLRVLLAATAVLVLFFCGSLLFQPSLNGLLVAALLSGIALGGTYPVGAVLLAQRFGAPSVGTALGLHAPLMSALSMAALYFVGAVHDRTHSYSFAFLVFGIVCVLATAMVPLIRKLPSAAADRA